MRKQKTYSDSELMDGFRAGNEQCFAKVFNLYFHGLCFYSLKITKDQAAAEDITEESFVKIWERKEMFTQIDMLRSYLYKIVRNASLDWIKKKKRMQPLTECIDNLLSVAENAAFKNIIEAEVLNKLSAALEKLPPQGRKIIDLIFIEGKKTKEVANILGISQSTVKTLKGRSILKLRKPFNL